MNGDSGEPGAIPERLGGALPRQAAPGRKEYSASCRCSVVLGDGCKVQNLATIYKGVTLGGPSLPRPRASVTSDLYPRAHATNLEVV